MADTALVWFRRDLRLHDNPTLAAAAGHDELLPVSVVDPRTHGEQSFGGAASFRYRKLGPHRARFRRESLADLRDSLRERGTDLLVRRGRAADVLGEVADEFDVDAAYRARYPASEERARGRAVDGALAERGVAVDDRWTHTLYHPADLRRPPDRMADTFTPFKDRTEDTTEVRETVETPALPPLPGDPDPGDVPTLDEFGVDPVEPDDRAVLPFEGGESAGLERLREYVWERDHLREYRETRNGLLGADYSSKLSPWLNEGCLSPRRVYETVQRYEDERVANDSTYWLVFELTWRDFFQFQFAKHGDDVFRPEGIRGKHVDWRRDRAAFERWAAGETGVPFVDANMRELAATGYMSNRGRQNVASFLANNLRVDWRWGAAHFETALVDYDVASNYGNWAYNSQVGNDSRDRYFNIIKQARQYDSDAEYVGTWCPELDPLPPEYAHEPWTMSAAEQAEYGVELGVDYPEPMLDLEASYGKLR
jgi:deoxyribodipyrimidine photo-lyase